MTLDLSRFPRVPLGHWPTPLEEAPRLSSALGGPPVLIKRDDVNGLGGGGNKLRKLEFLLGAALADNVDTVITFGALQTNHGRQTAAACARLGLRCELVLTAKVPRDGDAYEQSGNVLLDHLFGARVHACATVAETEATYQRLLAEAAAEGRIVMTSPVGGSNGLGTLGYVAAAAELIDQLDARGISSARLVVPQGSGATAAGVVLGTALLGWPGRVSIASVSHPAKEAHEDLVRLVGEASALLGVEAPGLDDLAIDDGSIGPGYGVPTPEVWSALRLFASTEGVLLDPVYTGKAAAALVGWAERGELTGDEPIVFLHTGGLPGLYGYAPEAIAAVSA